MEDACRSCASVLRFVQRAQLADVARAPCRDVTLAPRTGGTEVRRGKVAAVSWDRVLQEDNRLRLHGFVSRLHGQKNQSA